MTTTTKYALVDDQYAFCIDTKEEAIASARLFKDITQLRIYSCEAGQMNGNDIVNGLFDVKDIISDITHEFEEISNSTGLDIEFSENAYTELEKLIAEFIDKHSNIHEATIARGEVQEHIISEGEQ